jgi:hypothetical protein
MHQQLWGYKVEEKLYVGVREQKRLNTTAVIDRSSTANAGSNLILSTNAVCILTYFHASETLFDLNEFKTLCF